jgi:hypothetical protein
VDFPSFDGDPVGWNTRVETYFEVQGTSDEVKTRLMKLSMEDGTINWFRGSMLEVYIILYVFCILFDNLTMASCIMSLRVGIR